MKVKEISYEGFSPYSNSKKIDDVNQLLFKAGIGPYETVKDAQHPSRYGPYKSTNNNDWKK